jgi:hypothetical protein
LLADAGLAQQRVPLGAPEGSSDRDLAVLTHEAVPESKTGKDRETVIGEGVAVEVANEPAASGVQLQPSQECHDLLVLKVVGELRCDDEIELLRRPVGEGIVIYEFDPGGRVGRFFRGSAGSGVQIDTGQLRVWKSPADFPKCVAAAAGNV